MDKIGIIGFGVVGKAIEHTLQKNYTVKKYDKYVNYDSFEEVANCNIVFISVPTPFNNDVKEVDMSAVTESFDRLSNCGFRGIAVIKSTIPLGSTDSLSSSYDIELCFNPEFLRESTSPFEDFENQRVVVIGTNDKRVFDSVKVIYGNVLDKDAEYVQVSPTTAEMIKYSQNATLASRVAIANIIFDACSKYDVDYSIVKSLGFDSFEILGPHMVEVPGPDGKRGFGGKCLPKDISGFNSLIKSDILSSIISYNKTLRDDLD